MTKQNPTPTYIGLARNLLAAYTAYRLGLRSIDYAMKTYVKQDVGRSWLELAEEVDRNVSESIAKNLISLEDAPPDEKIN